MDVFSEYFSKYPALLFGLLVTLGAAIAMYPPSCIALVSLIFLHKTDWIKAALIICASYCYTSFSIVPFEEEYQDATFALSDIRFSTTPFSKTLLAYGVLYAPGKKPVSCSTLLKKKTPRENFLFYETVHRIGTRLYGIPKEIHSLKINKRDLFFPSFAYFRLELKKKVLSYIHKQYDFPLARNFLQTIATGLSVSTSIEEHFSRCGLSHILAVSGFHFTLLLMSTFYLLKKWCGIKPGAFCCAILASLLQAYYGETASVLRAYEMSLFVFLAFLTGRTPRAPNLLGIALICSLIINPLALTQLGFQLSFTATLGLLTLFPALRERSIKYLPKLPYLMVKPMPYRDKILYLLSRMILSVFLLTASISLVTIPILLSWFHSYPLSTLLYNLFMPPLLAFSILLFLIGIFFPIIHLLNGWYLRFILTPIEYQPSWTMGILYQSFHPFLALVTLLLLFGFAFYALAQREQLLKT